MCVTLLVEDNPTFRRSLKEMLSCRFPAMTIREAANGTEAMDKVKDCLPDLVFMDIKLPGVNGLELTRRIKSKYNDITIIVLTSHDLPEYREAAFQSGANFFFTKGQTTGDELSSLVQSLIQTGPTEISAGINLSLSGKPLT